MAKSHRRRRAARSMGKHSVKDLSSSNRDPPLAMLEEDEGSQFDWLSNLPDDMLLNIVERLDTADATRTSILSKRWKQIPNMLSKILIMVGPTDSDQDRSDDDVARATATMLAATQSLLEHRSTSASAYPIHHLCMHFFLGDESIRIGRISANTIATHKVGVAEFTILTEKEGKRCSADDRLAYGKKLNSLINDSPNAFSCLTRLKLENLTLGESDFPKIFRLCKRLEFLHLENCDMGFQSLLEVEHQRLRELEIFRCDFERVDLNWLPELTTLTISSFTSLHDPLSCGYVPLLHTVSIRNSALSWQKMLKLSEFLGKATVSNLTLGFEKEKIWVTPEDPRELSQVFSKLRLMNLAAISKECDLTWTMFVLHGAPSLEELCIRVCDCFGVWDKDEREKFGYSEERKDVGAKWEAYDFKHCNLAVLRIFGFQSKDKFLNYAKAVIKAAVNLKDIYLHEKPACKVGCSRRSKKYPRSTMEKNFVRSSLSMHTHPLLRLHFSL
ncbi:putative F-box protein At3g58820 [Lolium rigidum]|uniref:putative F-box protein At3g58820 n=1 Tax=Lolium rigidum TaxID=89674 RepID=UPI001F5C819A|nr:putative F-box protein At3g58820 [Lolium rigidum]